MTDPAEGGNDDIEQVTKAADKVERRLLHVPFMELMDQKSRELWLEFAKKVV